MSGRAGRGQALVLPVGLILALIVGLLLPAPGAAVGAWQWGPLDWSTAGVMVVFLIVGLGLHGIDVHGPSFVRAAGLMVLTALLLAPFLAAVAVRSLPVPAGVALGFVIMAAVPTTLSSAVVTAAVALGSRVWAVGLTVVSVAVGSLTAPLVISLGISAEVAVPPGPLLLRVVLIVVVPLVVGALVARLTGVRLAQWWSVVPSLIVVSVVWVTVSESRDSLLGLTVVELALIAAAVLGAHLLLLGAGWLVGRGLSRDEAVAALFVTAQKTLPIALSLIVAVTAVAEDLAPAAALAVVVCLLWHFLQLIVDSLLAARLARTVSVGVGRG